jgi:hypothetical protein
MLFSPWPSAPTGFSWSMAGGCFGTVQAVRPQVGPTATQFTAAFDAVFAAEGIEVLCTPVWAPRANAYAERWVGTVRREVLDRMLIFGRRQLTWVLAEYPDHYNVHRPHRALGAGVAARARRVNCRRAG